jgi:uncharacterized protein YndB with AHSA1/START domain
MTANAQNGVASTEKKTFSRTTTIQQQINAEPAVIWSLLTDASSYPEWNSTIVSLNGTIAEGEKIRLVSTLDSNRTFKLKVKEFVPNERLVWGDGMGQRTYTLSKNENGILFTMTEKIGGFMFPLFANKIPSFDASFQAFTADLKAKAEK